MAVNDPVVNGEGLVGKVTLASSDGAVVSLITDSEVGVSAKDNATGVSGIVQPKVGDPNDLLLGYLPTDAIANPGDYIVTAGSVAGQSESLFPRGIPIGQVTSTDENSPYRTVNVHPLVNLHDARSGAGADLRPGRARGPPEPGGRESSGWPGGERVCCRIRRPVGLDGGRVMSSARAIRASAAPYRAGARPRGGRGWA